MSKFSEKDVVALSQRIEGLTVQLASLSTGLSNRVFELERLAGKADSRIDGIVSSNNNLSDTTYSSVMALSSRVEKLEKDSQIALDAFNTLTANDTAVKKVLVKAFEITGERLNELDASLEVVAAAVVKLVGRIKDLESRAPVEKTEYHVYPATGSIVNFTGLEPKTVVDVVEPEVTPAADQPAPPAETGTDLDPDVDEWI